MAPKCIPITQKLADTIRQRRVELGLTIEEAAVRAGVGAKTWYRYETGGSIREDKYKGVCRALNWHVFPNEVNDDLDIENELFGGKTVEDHEAYSSFLEKAFSREIAISFCVGSDILSDEVQADLSELAGMPKGSHIGEISNSFLAFELPQRFLTRYDYDFLYAFKVAVHDLRTAARLGKVIVAHSVLEELALYLIAEKSHFLAEDDKHYRELVGGHDHGDAFEWAFDLMGDSDVILLYDDDFYHYIDREHAYHYDHWMDQQFYTDLHD